MSPTEGRLPRTSHPARGIAAGACAIFLLTSLAPEAKAEGPADAAAARALFTEGRNLSSQGKYEEACPKFQESLRLKPGIGTRFNLADCWEKVGRTASAWAEFLEAAAAAKASGQRDRESVARSRASALEAKLSYLTLESEEADPQLRVTRDGVEVGRGAFGSAVPVDPGVHVVEASSPTKQPWSTSQEVKAGTRANVSIPKLAPRNSATDVATNTTPLTDGSSLSTGSQLGAQPQALDSQPAGGLGGQRLAALAVGGLGVVGVAAGAVFLVRFDSKNDEAKALCPTGTCAAAEIERHGGLIEDAKSQRTLSYVGFGAGGALLVTGAVLFLTAPSSDSSAARLHVQPSIGRAFQAISLSGRF